MKRCTQTQAAKAELKTQLLCQQCNPEQRSIDENGEQTLIRQAPSQKRIKISAENSAAPTSAGRPQPCLAKTPTLPAINPATANTRQMPTTPLVVPFPSSLENAQAPSGQTRPVCVVPAQTLGRQHLNFLPAHPGRAPAGDHAEKTHALHRAVRLELKHLPIHRVTFKAMQEVKLIGRCTHP